MSKFATAIATNNIDRIIDEQYGQYGHFNEEAADAIWKAACAETAAYFRITLAAMLAVNVMNESTFNLYVKPNTNTKHKPENIYCPAAWDFGTTQINFFWNVLDAFEGNIRFAGLGWRNVFGTPPFVAEQPFTGDPVANIRACARIMFSKQAILDKGVDGATLQETQVVYFTGGSQERKDHRRADWRKYEPLFKQFFEVYQ